MEIRSSLLDTRLQCQCAVVGLGKRKPRLYKVTVETLLLYFKLLDREVLETPALSGKGGF